MQIIAIKDFGMTDFAKIDEMTLSEFLIKREAVELRQVDELYNYHLQAWLSQTVQAQTKTGKPKYKKFSDFFDHEKSISQIKNHYRGTADRQGLAQDTTRAHLAKIRANLADYYQNKGGD